MYTVFNHRYDPSRKSPRGKRDLNPGLLPLRWIPFGDIACVSKFLVRTPWLVQPGFYFGGIALCEQVATLKAWLVPSNVYFRGMAYASKFLL